MDERTELLLQQLGIDFGVQPNPHGFDPVDVDPTLALLSHIWACISALKEVNRVYRKQGSKATTIGALSLFGFQMELARIVNNIVTLDAFENETENDVLLTTAIDIFKKFPELATNKQKNTGKSLVHVMGLISDPLIYADYLIL